MWPSLRGSIGLGVGVGVAPDEGAAFVGGLTAGMKLLLPAGGSRHVLMGLELGFSSTAGYGRVDQTLWSAGYGFGFLWDTVGVGWAPRALVGTRDDQVVWGVRNGLRLYLVASFVDLEVAHQYTVDSRGDRHEMIISAGLDVGLLAAVVLSSVTNHRAPPPQPARPAELEVAR